MTITERLHRLVDVLPQTERETAAHVLQALAVHAGSVDPLALTLALAPEDDEPVTDEDREAIAAGWADHNAKRGISTADLRRELGLS